MNAADLKHLSRAKLEIVFNCGVETFRADGSTVRGAIMKGFGFELPRGMRAAYWVSVDAAGKITVWGTKQARSKHGKRDFRYTGPQAETLAQAEILKWSARILRERRDEVPL